MNEDLTSNIAFAGLTAAGKTTHARRLAAELGYEYVSATDILLGLLGIRDPSEEVWRTRLEEIHAAREDGSVDAELEERLVSLSRARRRTVFDTWALAWIGDGPLVRIWIESDLESRARKCQVSLGAARPSLPNCRALLGSKDTFNREVFRARHGFDLFIDRDRYDAVLDNSHLIPQATAATAHAGIDAFAPIVHAAAISLMTSDRPAAHALLRSNPREVQRLSV
ncbi:cytidylate kinase family protein [Pseudofrankia asymbiotica]|uniref:Cytidylate kinase n=1 Tax=Pseudofrankia asymbiotica TaxID=1834516 RepID=A0A1V2I036_9ACTN|nr:cytidylate kinase family protein [Pseudofrankia asymbiotica]ONH22647.1 cytidylate kinase [Pseudofrankia asymbiotica]